MAIKRGPIAACLFLLFVSACSRSGKPVESVVSNTIEVTQASTIIQTSTFFAPTQTPLDRLAESTIELATATILPSPTQESTPTAGPTPTKGPTPTLAPDAWQKAPVIPTIISQRVRLIYEMGLLSGNNPQAFSKVGDCNTTMPYFLGDFDSAGQYELGEFGDLQETIDFFSGSYSRKSLAAKDGLTAHASLSVLWNTWKECETYETPLTCEYRIQRPMYALISFGTNDANGTVDFEIALRKVIEMTIGNSTIPILSTKADNAEGDHSINQAIVRLAYEYDLPLWNYWLAVQTLPDKGLRSPEHLSVGPDGFSTLTGENLNFGWPIRNLTALQVLDMVRKAVEEGR